MRILLFMICLKMVLVSVESNACDCSYLPINDQLESSKAVFIGKLIGHDSITNVYTPLESYLYIHNFEVISYYPNGVYFKRTKIVSIFKDRPCDIDFNNYAIGDTFLVFANNWNNVMEYPLFLNTGCTRTKLLKNADKEDIGFLKSPKWKKAGLYISAFELEQQRKRVQDEAKEQRNLLLLIVLIISLILNAFLLVLFFRKRRKISN